MASAIPDSMDVRLMKPAWRLLAAAACAVLAAAPFPVSAKPQVRLVTDAERANEGIVSIISGTPGGSYFRMASELALLLEEENGLRVLPIMGKGAGQNAYDILYLKGIDAGFVRTDTIEQLKEDARVRNPTTQVVYIARLFNDELHVITKRDVTDVKQLAGKKVSFDVKGSGSDYSGRAMFAGIGVPVEAVNVDQAAALQMLARGEIAAVVSVAAKPVSFVSAIKGDQNLRILNIPYPTALADRYFPTEVGHADYPALVPEGETVKTLAVGTILAAFNHARDTDRYVRLARFTDAFFRRFNDLLQPSRHPKWQEVSLAATVPGWTRFQPAQEWLDRNARETAAAEAERQRALRAEIQVFLEQKVLSIDSSREELLKDYLSWKAAKR